MDTLIQKRCFEIIKINNFRGELTDISARKEALVRTVILCHCRLFNCAHLEVSPETAYYSRGGIHMVGDDDCFKWGTAINFDSLIEIT